MDEKSFETKQASTEEDVIGFYDAYADDWDERFGDAPSNGWFLERRWRSFSDALHFAGAARGTAVELGVGTGVYIERTSGFFGRVIAVDGSERMLGILRERLAERSITNVDVLHANAVDLAAIDSGAVDCVYFFGLVEHIINLDAFTSEIGRILSPGGVVVGVTPNGRCPWYKLRGLFRGTGKHCSTDTYHSEESLDRIFLAKGFAKVSVEKWGAVPAGTGGMVARLLTKLEPILERSVLRDWLGGLTFVYRR